MQYIPLGIAVIALAILLSRGYSAYSAHVDGHAFAAVVIRMLRQGQRERALKICHAVGDAPFGRMLRTTLSTADATAKDLPNDRARSALLGRFDEAFAAEQARVAAARSLTMLGLSLLALAVVAQHILGDDSLVTLYVAVGGVVVALFTAIDVSQAFRQARQNIPAILDALLAAPKEPESATSPPTPPMEPRHEAVGPLVFDVMRGAVLVKTVVPDGSILKVGKDARCHIQLDDKLCSRMHAVVEIADDATTVIDLGNKTGTRVNGAEITKSAISAGDAIEIGEHRIVLRRASTPAPAAAIEAHAPVAALAPSDPADPRGWRGDAGLLFGFTARSPDVVHALLLALATKHLAGSGVRLAKMSREVGTPRCLVAALGSAEAIESLARAIEAHGAEHAQSFASRPAEVAPEGRAASIDVEPFKVPILATEASATGYAEALAERATYFAWRAAIADGAFKVLATTVFE